MKLEEIEKLCEEATPGPWHIQKLDHEGGGYTSFQTYNDLSENGPSTCEIASNYIRAKIDIEFIAACRELMPKLLKIAKVAKEFANFKNDTIGNSLDYKILLDRLFLELEQG